MELKRLVSFFVVTLVALALWLAWLWQPERQVRRHTRGLLKAVEGRRWSKVEALLADSYSDRWGHDKAFVLDGLRQVFGGFVFLTIEHREVGGDVAGGKLAAQVKKSGQGNVVAQFVMTTVNELGEPFTFTWHRRGGGPWDWELVSVDHPTLDPARMPQF